MISPTRSVEEAGRGLPTPEKLRHEFREPRGTDLWCGGLDGPYCCEPFQLLWVYVSQRGFETTTVSCLGSSTTTALEPLQPAPRENMLVYKDK